MFADKEKMSGSDNFEIDDENTIHVRSNGRKVLVGETAIYTVV